MSGVEWQRPHRLKGNHREKGFAADIATHMAAKDFTRSRADEQRVGDRHANLSSACCVKLTGARATDCRSRAEVVRVPLLPRFVHCAERISLGPVSKPKPMFAFGIPAGDFKCAVGCSLRRKIVNFHFKAVRK